MSLIQVAFKQVRNGASVPTIGSPGSAGYDLRAYIEKDGVPGGSITVPPTKQALLIPTGIAIEIRKPNVFAAIYPRSGLGHRGLVLGNGTGVIDNDYRGEILISVLNRASESFMINHGDRIAQLVFMPYMNAIFFRVEDFESDTERGKGGFGSTGG